MPTLSITLQSMPWSQLLLPETRRRQDEKLVENQYNCCREI
jgi:hypothetical protein